MIITGTNQYALATSACQGRESVCHVYTPREPVTEQLESGTMVMKVRMKGLHTCVTRCQVSPLGTISYGPWPAFTGVKLVPWHLQCTVLVTLLNRMSHVGGNLCR